MARVALIVRGVPAAVNDKGEALTAVARGRILLRITPSHPAHGDSMNLWLKASLYQGLAVLACLALGALVGWAVSGDAVGAQLGGLAGFVLGLVFSGIYYDAIRRYGPPTDHTPIQAILLALILPSPERILVGVVVAAALVGGFYLPYLNLPLVYAAWPVFEANPGFKKTGPDVMWWFFGPMIRSVKAFLFFTLYFMVLSYPFLIGLGYKALRKREQKLPRPDSQGDPTVEPGVAPHQPHE